MSIIHWFALSFWWM